MPSSSSSSSATVVARSSVFSLADRVDRVGLAATGERSPAAPAAGGGLLLPGSAAPRGLEGLTSWYCRDLRGVLWMSAYFQKGAGELVGMCWLGRWAVLGGARRGCTRCGAGVTNDAPSSGRYDDESVGGDRGSVSANELDGPSGLRRGSGLPSWKLAGPVGRLLRSGVT